MRRILAAAMFAAMTLASVSPGSAQVANDSDTLVLGARVDNNSFDRAQLMLGNQIQYWQPVFDTLLVQEPSGKIVPNMAKEWSYNADNTVLTLTLRDGITFTDGTPFDAASVQANLEFLAAGAGQNGYMARSIASYEIVSDNVIKLHLKAPDPALVVNLALVGGAMASPAALGAEGSDVAPVGSGPYELVAGETVPGSHYTYRRNPDYWNPEAYPFDTISIVPIDETVARNNALFSGQVDGVIGNARVVEQAKAQGMQVNTGDVNWAGLIIADRGGTMAGPLADVRVRRALNMAFDKAGILKHLDGDLGRLTDSIFPKTSAAYDPSLDDLYPYDPEAAKKLLADAGYADGFPLTFPEIPPFRAYEPIITQELAAIGVTATFKGLPPGSVLPVLRKAEFPIYFFTFGSHDAWTDIQQHLAPDAGWNSFHYSDPKLNALIEAAQTSSGAAQDAAFKAVNDYVTENAFFAPWYRRWSIYLTGPDTDVKMQPGNVAPFIRNYSKHM